MAAFARSAIVIRHEPKVQARVLQLPVPTLASSRWVLHAVVLSIGFAAFVGKVVA